MSKLVITLDSTQVKEYLTCPHSWALAYKLNLRKSGYWKKEPLEKGQIVHRMMDTFYNLRSLQPNVDRMAHAKTAMDLIRATKVCFEVFKKSEALEIENFLCLRFLQYVTKWTHWDFIPQVRNFVPGVELGFSKVLIETDTYIGVIEGKIDLVSTLPSGDGVIIDHKTRGQNKNLYSFKPQVLTYLWATGYHNFAFNYFSTATTYNDESFSRKLVQAEQWQIDRWESKLKDIVFNVYEAMTFLADEKFENNFERNLGACAGAWETNPCQFTMLCDNAAGYRESLKAMYYETVPAWSPWNEEVTSL